MCVLLSYKQKQGKGTSSGHLQSRDFISGIFGILLCICSNLFYPFYSLCPALTLQIKSRLHIWHMNWFVCGGKIFLESVCFGSTMSVQRFAACYCSPGIVAYSLKHKEMHQAFPTKCQVPHVYSRTSVWDLSSSSRIRAVILLEAASFSFRFCSLSLRHAAASDTRSSSSLFTLAVCLSTSCECPQPGVTWALSFSRTWKTSHSSKWCARTPVSPLQYLAGIENVLLAILAQRATIAWTLLQQQQSCSTSLLEPARRHADDARIDLCGPRSLGTLAIFGICGRRPCSLSRSFFLGPALRMKIWWKLWWTSYAGPVILRAQSLRFL